jgi:hypothetical protein
MPSFIEILEEIAEAKPVVSIPRAEVDKLVDRFGNRVRLMGRWNASTDGSLDIPVTVVRDAATALGNQALSDALSEIKTESFADLLENSAAIQLIEKIREAYDRYFRWLMSRYQSSTDPAETTRLRDQLVSEVFGE